MRRILLLSLMLGSAFLCGCPFGMDNNATGDGSTGGGGSGVAGEDSAGANPLSAGASTSPGPLDYGTMVKRGEVFTVHTEGGDRGGMDTTYTIKNVTEASIVYFQTTLGKNERDRFAVRKPDPKKGVHMPASWTRTGSESIVVSGVEIPCDTYEMDDPDNAGKKATIWIPTEKLPPFIPVKTVDGTGRTTAELKAIKGQPVGPPDTGATPPDTGATPIK